MQSALECIPYEQSKTSGINYQFMECDNYDEMLNVLSGGSSNLRNRLTQAKNFQYSLWINDEHITSLVDSYYIYGDGVNTIQGLA